LGGVKRTKSELKLVGDEFLPLVVSDLLRDHSLPIGIVGSGLVHKANVMELDWPV